MNRIQIDLNKLAAELQRDEDFRGKPYKDTVGKNSVGYGHNLDDKPITARAAAVILDDDISDAIADLDRSFSWWRTMSDARQRVLANMCFNMGIVSLLEFKHALAAMKTQDWATAEKELRDSKWYSQVGSRADRLCEMMRQG